MVDRIRQLLQTRQLSPTQFADAIGVARPIVSHILGGRNKPSLEVVQKIIAAFPDVSMPWLLTGQGPMLVADVAPIASKPAEQPSSPVVPAEPPAPVRRQAKAEKTVDAAETARVSAATNQVLNEPVRPASALPAEATSQPLATDAASAVLLANALAAPTTKPAKTIRRVLIFYSDGTFADFSPTSEAL